MFTDMELALMEGGHSLPDKPESFSFIKGLYESRLMRSVNDLKFSYSEVCDYLMLVVLTLEFLTRVKEGRDLAENYARITSNYINYSEFKTTASDLYNLIYFVQAEPNVVEKIFKSEDSKRIRMNTQLPRMELNRWLMQIANKQSKDLYFFMRLEQSLNVQNSDIKDIRRLLAYNTPNDSDLRLIAYRILNIYRQKMPTFDIRSELEHVLTLGKYTYIK